MWGGAVPPCLCSFCPSAGFPLFFLILSSLSSVPGTGPPLPTSLSLSGPALLSEVEGSLGQLQMQAVGLGTSET